MAAGAGPLAAGLDRGKMGGAAMRCAGVGRLSGPGLPGVESMTTDEELMEADEIALVDELERLEAVRAGLGRMGSRREKVEFLQASELCTAFRKRMGPAFQGLLCNLPEDAVLMLLCLIAIGQEHVLGQIEGPVHQTELEQLAEDLAHIEQFYDSLGGIVGYQLKTLELILTGLQGERRGEDGRENGMGAIECLEPSFLDLSQEGNGEEISHVVMEGIKSLPFFAEIYAIGGAGDRLGLVDPSTGEPLPSALLRYCGRTMLDGLIRDVQNKIFTTESAKWPANRLWLEPVSQYSWHATIFSSTVLNRRPLSGQRVPAL
ncbi:unnamed protein product [Ostreobium quekettii]|uniref:Uncharacterized protein n=1 Tax=Ostreobium quekettii TaxID=121088 RepID=A0A8S1IPC6_9CHLO|nr:unnamed protein product [Ostreobium quekettii]